MLQHVRWIKEHLAPDGVFISDSFTAGAYSYSGYLMGYKAHYYTPEVYSALMDYVGFDGLSAPCTSGRDRLNHVMVFSVA